MHYRDSYFFLFASLGIEPRGLHISQGRLWSRLPAQFLFLCFFLFLYFSGVYVTKGLVLLDAIAIMVCISSHILLANGGLPQQPLEKELAELRTHILRLCFPFST